MAEVLWNSYHSQFAAETTRPETPFDLWMGCGRVSAHIRCRLHGVMALHSNIEIEMPATTYLIQSAALKPMHLPLRSSAYTNNYVAEKMASGRFQLSQHPEAEARMVQELQGIGLLATPAAPVPRSSTPADLSKLPYMACIMKVRWFSGGGGDHV